MIITAALKNIHPLWNPVNQRSHLVAGMAHLVGTVNLGDVGHEVQDTAGVAPLCRKLSVNIQKDSRKLY
jgi:hypothetical protein